MKVGDLVRHKNKRPKETALVIESVIKTTWDDFKDRAIVSTSYTARYNDGSLLKFHGYNVGKTIFVAMSAEQLSIYDLIEEKEKEENELQGC